MKPFYLNTVLGIIINILSRSRMFFFPVNLSPMQKGFLNNIPTLDISRIKLTNHLPRSQFHFK